MKHDAERPDVASRVCHFPAQDLGCHVGERSSYRHVSDCGRRRGVTQRFALDSLEPSRNAEVEHLQAAIARDRDVRALQIPVHDTAIVRMRQRTGELSAIVDRAGRRYPTPVYDRIERLTVDVLHRDERIAIQISDFENRADVRMVDRRCVSGLAYQTVSRQLVQRLIAQHFEGNRALETRVVRAVDDAHSTGAEACLYPEPTERSGDDIRRLSYIGLHPAATDCALEVYIRRKKRPDLVMNRFVFTRP